jgi:hypothetical protein
MKGATQLKIWKLRRRYASSRSPVEDRPIIRRMNAESRSISVVNATAFQNENARHVTNLRSVKNWEEHQISRQNLLPS